MPVLDSRVHTLIGHFTIFVGGVDVTGYAENVTFDTNTSGGFGSCSFSLRPPAAPPEYEDPIRIDGDEEAGFFLWEGKVVNAPDTPYTAENVSYQITGEGPYRDYGRESDFAYLLVDREVGNWKQLDCQNWETAPGFELTGDNTARLRIAAPDMDALVEDRSNADL